MIDIHSPRGIGGATIRSASGGWPESVSLRLHLRGLENLEISNGELALTSSVLIRRGAPNIRGAMRSASSASPDERTEVRPGDPGWLDVRILDPEGRPVDRLPLEAGYFEIALPAMLVATRPAELEISWIDFYR